MTTRRAAQYAYDDYRRRILGEKDAGLEDAIGWLESKYTQELGWEALAQISSPVAEAKLAEAARSTDSRLAGEAARLLENRRERKARDR